MKRYSYKALTPAGDIMAGMIEAESEADLKSRIEARGMMAVEVTQEGDAGSPANFRWQSLFQSRPSSKQATEFLQQLSALLSASIRLDHALELLSHKDLSGNMADLVRDIRRAILSGEALSAALHRHNDIFPDSLRALIALAEQSGTLPDMISAIVTERERSEKLRQKAVDAMTYPVFLLIAVVGVLVFFITFVLPQFRSIIADLGQKADPMLLALLDVSAFLEQNRTSSLLALAMIVASLVLIFSSEPRRRKLLAFILKAPGLRMIDRDYRTARFCRNFGHLVERGISLADAIDLTGKAIATPATVERFRRARDEIRQGRRVFDALERTEALSPIALRMLRIGEETGRIPLIAKKAADLFETRVERQMEKAVGLIGPIAIIIVSVVVGGLIVSVMTALMSVNQMVG